MPWESWTPPSLIMPRGKGYAPGLLLVLLVSTAAAGLDGCSSFPRISLFPHLTQDPSILHMATRKNLPHRGVYCKCATYNQVQTLHHSPGDLASSAPALLSGFPRHTPATQHSSCFLPVSACPCSSLYPEPALPILHVAAPSHPSGLRVILFF